MRNLDNQPLTVRIATTSGSVRGRVGYCLACESKLRSKNSRKEFCSDRCRLLHWAVRVLVKEYKNGKLNGLRALIQEMCE